MDSRDWYYYPIVIPLVKGQGPATSEECDEITYEVWDRDFNVYGSYENLYCAINKALELNNG